MRRDDTDLEKYLGEFQPRAVRPLEAARPTAKAWMRRLAAAAGLAFAVGGGAWLAVHLQKDQDKTSHIVEPKKESVPSGVRKRLPMVQLTRLAVEDPDRLDVLLAEAPRKSSSARDEKESMLGTLAKE
ncbi:MAG: hypothetical protein ACHQT6_05710 [Candidatus Acidiferrales bacterium]